MDRLLQELIAALKSFADLRYEHIRSHERPDLFDWRKAEERLKGASDPTELAKTLWKTRIGTALKEAFVDRSALPQQVKTSLENLINDNDGVQELSDFFRTNGYYFDTAPAGDLRHGSLFLIGIDHVDNLKYDSGTSNPLTYNVDYLRGTLIDTYFADKSDHRRVCFRKDGEHCVYVDLDAINVIAANKIHMIRTHHAQPNPCLTEKLLVKQWSHLFWDEFHGDDSLFMRYFSSDPVLSFLVHERQHLIDSCSGKGDAVMERDAYLVELAESKVPYYVLGDVVGLMESHNYADRKAAEAILRGFVQLIHHSPSACSIRIAGNGLHEQIQYFDQLDASQIQSLARKLYETKDIADSLAIH